MLYCGAAVVRTRCARARATMSFSGLPTSAGLGLRISTPFVLLRVDAGVPFDSAFGARRPRWFFSIGQMF